MLCESWGKESEWFHVRVGLRQGCVMSPWLFNMYMEGVVKELKRRVMERGVALRISGEGREWEVNELVFVDDTTLVTDSEKLSSLVKKFESF